MGDLVTTFHLLRHTSHDLLGRVLVGRSVDVPLNRAGEWEAQMLAWRLEDEPITRIISSPRRRARETAGPIAAALRLDVDIASELDEHDCGDWSGQPFDVLRADPLWCRWNAERGTVRPPGGETMAELQARVVGLLHELHDRHPDGTLLLVSHAEPIRAALMHAHGVPLDDFLTVEVGPGSISTAAIGRQNQGQGPSARVLAQGVL